jgi:hypothetical protein
LHHINVKWRGKITSFSNKERPNSPVVIFILLFLKYLVSYLTGKIDAESGKIGVFYIHGLNAPQLSSPLTIGLDLIIYALIFNKYLLSI